MTARRCRVFPGLIDGIECIHVNKIGHVVDGTQYSITDTIDVDILLHNKCGHSLQCLVLQQLLQVDHYHMVLNIKSDILFCGYY